MRTGFKPPAQFGLIFIDGGYMKKLTLLNLSLYLILFLNYTAWPLEAKSEYKNKDAKISLIKDGKRSKIKLSEIDKFVKYDIAGKLVEIILASKESLLEKPGLNPEIDVTDKESMLKEGKTLLNQTTYLRKAGIDPETTSIGSSPEDTINATLKESRLVYYTSLVDIDSDGENEIRFYSVQGTLLEEDNYFFKKNEDGKYRLIDNCNLGGSEMAIFIKHKKTVYAAERNKENKLSFIKVYLFDGKKEKFEPLFTIETGIEGKKGKNISLTLQ